MKINELLTGQLTTNAASGKRSATGINFLDLLENQLNSISDSKKVDQVAGTSEVTSVSPSLRLAGLSITEDVLTHLDQFSTALGKQRTNAADLEPFVTALEEETSALVSVKGELAAGDPLASLLDKVAAAAYVETAKYRRGDYTA